MRRRLRDRVTIQERTTEQNSYGEELFQWSTVKSVPCSIEPLNGREYFAARAENDDVKHRVRFRYEPNMIKVGYRLLDERISPNRVLDIESVINPRNLNHELICMCRERI